MGSEGPRAVTINVTGFKKFQGVSENPTETIVNNLRSFVERKGLPPGVTLGSCTVLEAAGDGALPMLYKVLESGIPPVNSASNEQVVWVSSFFTMHLNSAQRLLIGSFIFFISSLTCEKIVFKRLEISTIKSISSARTDY